MVTKLGPAAQADARRALQETRHKLAAQTATSADHGPALEAIMLLDDDEASRWLEEIRHAFTDVYARERKNRRRAEEGAPVST